MTIERQQELEALALRVREHILELSTDGGCFIGASLSCADLLVYLYSEFLRITPTTTNDPNRDYLLLSKGHDVPALYGVFAECDFMEPTRLRNHLRTNDSIYWHPNRDVKGVEFHSGSLGHLLSVGMGIAVDCKLRGTDNRIVVILGDGELNEGSIWEALLVAGAKQLDNLIVIVDRNEFQANFATEELIPLEPLQPKFSAFGCSVQRINGHDFHALEAALNRAKHPSEPQPQVIIADTVRGKGVPSIERRADRWFCNFSKSDIEQLHDELHGHLRATLQSETLVVR
jgi:transketolase